MSGVNKVILLGNLGRDPEIKQTESGATLATFSLATSEYFKDKNTGEKREQTEWHQLIGWRSIAESVERSNLKKGDRIYVEGKIRNKKWTDKEGNQKQSVEILVEMFMILQRRKETADINSY